MTNLDDLRKKGGESPMDSLSDNMKRALQFVENMEHARVMQFLAITPEEEKLFSQEADYALDSLKQKFDELDGKEKVMIILAFSKGRQK